LTPTPPETVSSPPRFQGDRRCRPCGEVTGASRALWHEADELITDEQKAALDALHLRKIDLADRVLVVNPGGYIGESTSREIAYAHATGKPISFTDPV
jgi:hypothetical protein